MSWQLVYYCTLTSSAGQVRPRTDDRSDAGLPGGAVQMARPKKVAAAAIAKASCLDGAEPFAQGVSHFTYVVIG
jgi:hypothetical protein